VFYSKGERRKNRERMINGQIMLKRNEHEGKDKMGQRYEGEKNKK
jgi:hypothetical protein